MLHDDQLFWGFSKSAIPVDDLDPVSRSQHWKSKAASCIFSVRFCQIMFQPVMWMLHTGRSIRWAIRHRKSKREGAWGSWCYVPMSFGSLHQNTLTVYHLCNRCTCIHVIYLCMQWTCIFLHGSCACFLHIMNYRSFILLLSATRKNLPLGGWGSYPTSVSGMIQQSSTHFVCNFLSGFGWKTRPLSSVPDLLGKELNLSIISQCI